MIFFPDDFTSFKELLGEDKFNRLAVYDADPKEGEKDYYKRREKEKYPQYTKNNCSDISIQYAFERLLKKHKVITKFIQYFKTYPNYPKGDYISFKEYTGLNEPEWWINSIVWDDTDEGYGFWERLNIEWLNILKERDLL